MGSKEIDEIKSMKAEIKELRDMVAQILSHVEEYQYEAEPKTNVTVTQTIMKESAGKQAGRDMFIYKHRADTLNLTYNVTMDQALPSILHERAFELLLAANE